MVDDKADCNHIFDETGHCFECNVPKPKSNADHQREFKARQKAAGLVQVQVWVPASMRDDIKRIAARMKSSASLNKVAEMKKGERLREILNAIDEFDYYLTNLSLVEYTKLPPPLESGEYRLVTIKSAQAAEENVRSFMRRLRELVGSDDRSETKNPKVEY